ncbi:MULTISPECIES: pyridoxamine 5'-phosphate oxidase family protein [Actinomadura]|uniref:Nitroimidazol reductase NimA, pyridoxamine 5'-phosphate oxidase superfamily n=1 Tax=Actinomadura madurae TaxID=1993 RepID=A0A1I5XV69_9ACTN|nr:pyridoxamine 5'-phosphate oxidase family protein [Actinomadura madurae]MCP9948113.1 pyridoxamine 5'-phosphate oxidase family protein [Actinomadura madurae]MCP9964886.1 pyridoxamine 5'-phosphate oxidase family protein [Actinomadura madurae]MCP9977373.1 pyridoxamine 5'-phosphate oxidase family protein [Actinomadura madurae]MCQ0011121.1 pyridoxamine 5'-phosphate oxidase family protein [Actinomadura madurae]MCQ0013554.1 pyridoxamine 5'-phosphate oxidase family protein [Actinomadura madurae]
MQRDQSGLEILDEGECRDLLAGARIGRIVFTHQALPAVQPVNFVLSRDHIVIKTSRTSRLATAAANTVVAFEIDEFDTAARTGWSVVVVGRARRVTDPRELAALAALPLRSWAPGEHDAFILVQCELVTGRRIAEPVVTP